MAGPRIKVHMIKTASILVITKGNILKCSGSIFVRKSCL